MANPKIKINGIRGPIPQGYVLGRSSAGTGDIELIRVPGIAIGQGPGGGIATPLPVIPGGTVLGNDTGAPGRAGPIPLSDLLPPGISFIPLANGGVPTDLVVLATGALVTVPYIGATPVSGGGGSGALVQIARIVTSGSQTSVTFASIAGTYSDLVMSYQARSANTSADDTINMTFNADTTAAHYLYSRDDRLGNATSTSAAFMQLAEIPGASATASFTAGGEAVIPNYAGSVFFKTFSAHQSNFDGTNLLTERAIGHWKSTVAITAINLVLNSGHGFVDGSTFTLWGRL